MLFMCINNIFYVKYECIYKKVLKYSISQSTIIIQALFSLKLDVVCMISELLIMTTFAQSHMHKNVCVLLYHVFNPLYYVIPTHLKKPENRWSWFWGPS